MSVERRSISTIHVFWRESGGASATAGWYIETRNSEGVVAESRQEGWDGPRPARYQADEIAKLQAHLQIWEPEARVIVHTEDVS